MKRFSLLSGAYINAGDFLIVDRTKKLLRYVYPDCEITEYKRDQKLDGYLEVINRTDALIIAGGPAYMMNIYPDIIPLVDNLEDIKTKIIAIGLGWYGKSVDEKYIDNYIFTKKTQKLLERISKDAKVLTCRDWYSVKVLNKNGFPNSILTGCPAWNNLEKKSMCTFRKNLDFKYGKICISDPANEVNLEESFILANYLHNIYPKSEIHFVFHRLNIKNLKINSYINKLKSLGIIVDDITGGVNGMEIYDDCDLHIGYRVHAHIYNSSNRNISIFIEEDGRGTGVNEALGILGIKAYNSFKIGGKNDDYIARLMRMINKKIMLLKKYSNRNFENNIKEYIDIIEQNNYSQYYTAFYNLKLYHEKMIDFISTI